MKMTKMTKMSICFAATHGNRKAQMTKMTRVWHQIDPSRSARLKLLIMSLSVFAETRLKGSANDSND